MSSGRLNTAAPGASAGLWEEARCLHLHSRGGGGGALCRSFPDSQRCVTGPPAVHGPLCCARSYLDIIEQAISEGDTLLIENIGETVDPVLDPLLGRNTIKKGK